MPAVVGAYLFLVNRFRGPGNNALMLVLLCVTIISAMPPWHVKRAQVFAQGKSAWVLAYKRTNDIASADVLAGFKIYPDPAETDLNRKLQWLRERHYSFFRTMH